MELISKEGVSTQISRQDARSRSVFLGLVSHLLNTALDFEAILISVAELSVPGLADWCVIDVQRTSAGGKNRVVAQDPLLISRQNLETVSFPSEYYEALKDGTPSQFALGSDSCVTLPLVARGEVLGMLTLGVAGSSRYSDGELEFIQELARMVGLSAHSALLVHDLKRINDARAELIAVVSHELKTPLTAMKLNSQLVQRSLSNPLTPKDFVLERMTVIDHSLGQLERITSDLLDSEKIEVHKLALDLQRVDIQEILSEIQFIFVPIAAEHKIEFKTESKATTSSFTCDRGRIIQVLSNLISNAIKFTPAGGSVHLCVFQETQNEIGFEVRDTGCGMDASHVKKSFDRYWQAKVSAAQGSGLGLYIAQGIVKAHRGRIWAESKLGAGSTFSFAIPISTAS